MSWEKREGVLSTPPLRRPPSNKRKKKCWKSSASSNRSESIYIWRLSNSGSVIQRDVTFHEAQKLSFQACQRLTDIRCMMCQNNITDVWVLVQDFALFASPPPTLLKRNRFFLNKQFTIFFRLTTLKHF